MAVNPRSRAVLEPAQGVTSSVPVAASEGGQVRISLLLAPESYDRLERLAEETSSSLEKLFVKALLLYETSVEARREGKAVGIAPSADVLETEFVGL